MLAASLGYTLSFLLLAIVALPFAIKALGGLALAVFGAACAIVLAGIGSSMGVGMAGEAAAGVTAEDPDLFGKLLLLQALPGTQGIYGFLAGFIVMTRIGVVGGGAATVLSMEQGWQVFLSCLPVAVTCLVTGIYQGRASVSAINLVAKRPDASGQALIIPAMVETYAVLGLLASILLIFGVKI